MGIKKLYKYVSDNNLIQYKDISQYKNTKIAIDISILLYQLVISVRNSGNDITNSKGKVISHILGLFNKTIWILSHNILPIFIFDGKSPDIKNNTVNNRKNIRKNALIKYMEATDTTEKIKYFKRSTVITQEQINECKELLDYMGIPYIQAQGEADILCAHLCKYGFVDAVSTEDMDILTFGSPKIIKNLFSKNKPIQEITLNNILSHTKLSFYQFIRFCIFLGCDYNSQYYNFSFQKAILLSKNIINDSMLDNTFDKQFSIDKPFQYFLQDNNFEYEINLNKPHNKLLELLTIKYGFIHSKINWKIKFLHSFFQNYN